MFTYLEHPTALKLIKGIVLKTRSNLNLNQATSEFTLELSTSSTYYFTDNCIILGALCPRTSL